MTTIAQNFSSGTVLKVADYSSVGMGEITPIPAAATTREPTSVNFYDSILAETEASSSWNNWECNPFSDAVVTNLNPEKATLANGVLTRVANGKGAVEFSKGAVKTRREYDVTATGGTTSHALTGFTPGTVAAALYDSVTAHADSDMSNRQFSYFSTVNHTSGTYVKNANCWARNIDLSCLSVGTKSPGGAWAHERPGVLITTRHIRCANHYRPNVGDLVRFVTPAGVVRELTVTGLSSLVEPDLIVATLSAEATGCLVAKVGASWMTQEVGNPWENYAGGMLIVTDKFRNVGIASFGNPVGLSGFKSGPTYPRYAGANLPGAGALTIYWSYDQPAFVPYQDIALGIGGGSSGSPWFALAGDQLIVMAQALTSNSGLLSWVSGPGGTGNIHNTLIAEADADTIARGSMVSPTGYTVTVATDPTL